MKRKNEVEHLKDVTLWLSLDCHNQKNTVYHQDISALLNNETAASMTFTGVSKYPGAKMLSVKVYIENDLMCFMEYSLSDSELLR